LGLKEASDWAKFRKRRI